MHNSLCIALAFILIVVQARSSIDVEKFLHAKPVDVPQSFDCAAKATAIDWAKHLQPWLSTETVQKVYDALQLKSCGSSLKEIVDVKRPLRPEHDLLREVDQAAGPSWYVSPTGSDTNPGTRDKPFRTISHAVVVSRSASGAKTVVLLQGTHYLSEPLVLTPADSNLALIGDTGKQVIVSGGIPLDILSWTPYKVSGQEVEVYPGYNNIFGRISQPGSNTTTIRFLGNFKTSLECQKACLRSTTNKCLAFTHFDPSVANWGSGCYSDITTVWGPLPQTGLTTGKIRTYNIYVTDLSHQTGLSSITGLKVGGRRAWRGRYPDSNPETVFYPDGWMSRTAKWLLPTNISKATTLTVDEPNRNDIATEFQKFTLGIGGPCSVFDPPESYWCSDRNSGGGAAVFSAATGMVLEPWTFLGQSIKSLKGAVVHAFHWAHWALWMFEVENFDPSTNTITWTKGGFQGARGAAGRGGSDWYIENFLEGVDSPNEYFFDEDSKKLYYFNNGTQEPSLSTSFVATNLKTLISVYGSQESPVTGISISGIEFREAAYTYMDPHAVPSGGDWSLQRGAALFFEGSENLLVDNCTFVGLDGNAIILTGYNRDATIQKSTFEWLGENGIILWGNTKGIDGTDGNQPRKTKILYNLFREVGIWEKQSSPFFQAKSCQTLIQGNIMFNGPRALINFNDGFGGANEITQNLLFNPNRETSDQGPFNSWDRQPFLTDVKTGSPSLIPEWNRIHENFMICNYGSNLCIDNDDGSAYYKNFNNFHVYGGHKSDFGGHSKLTYNTINAYAQVYENGVCTGFGSVWLPGYADGYYNNTCIQSVSAPYAVIPNCNPAKIDPKTMPILNSNMVYNQKSQLTVQCAGKTFTEAEFQKMGYDPKTTVGPMPTDQWIIQQGRKMLKF